ncbi:hypothetical protein ACTHO0_10620 [Cytobacillus praedii]|uniref:hypothetical protein n=1 Tax=Cytobacillus praedii TaxID=1742358 RepID=UPI002E1D8633|nr:hypothetical protein [Cytobacillus praedii]
MAVVCCITNNNHEGSEQKVPSCSSKETDVDYTSPDNNATLNDLVASTVLKTARN